MKTRLEIQAFSFITVVYTGTECATTHHSAAAALLNYYPEAVIVFVGGFKLLAFMTQSA